LQHNSTGLASDFRLRSAFDVISSDPLSSVVSLQLSAWNFARVSFSSIHSTNTVGEQGGRSNFVTLASSLHLLSVARRWHSFRFPPPTKTLLAAGHFLGRKDHSRTFCGTMSRVAPPACFAVSGRESLLCRLFSKHPSKKPHVFKTLARFTERSK